MHNVAAINAKMLFEIFAMIFPFQISSRANLTAQFKRGTKVNFHYRKNGK